MSEIAMHYGITFFLGNCTAITTIAHKQSIYKWNVGVGFEGDEERNLKIKKNYWHQFTGIKMGFFILAVVLSHQKFY